MDRVHRCDAKKQSARFRHCAAVLLATFIGFMPALDLPAGTPAQFDVAGPEIDPNLPVKLAGSVKTIVDAEAAVLTVAELPKRPEPPASRMSLAQYLESQLGRKKFRRREEWAGRTGAFEPVTAGRRVWKPIGTVKYLTIHHAEGVPNEHAAKMIRVIYKGHTGDGGRLEAADVGYHFFVDSQGQIWEGRNASRLGTHVGSKPDGLNNSGNIGICGLGSYSHSNPPKAMADAMLQLCTLVSEYYGRQLKVRGHEDWYGINGFKPRGGVGCPGKLAPTVKRANTVIAAAFEAKERAAVMIAEGKSPEGSVVAVASPLPQNSSPSIQKSEVIVADLPLDTSNAIEDGLQIKKADLGTIKTVIDSEALIVAF
jgi:hypothetical protein